jgi:hypothetical protein
MYITRTLEAKLKDQSEQFPILLVTGARQVGKTTLLQHIGGKDRVYVTLDDPLIATLAREDPALFIQRFPPPVLIDEIQYAPQLLPYIKMEVDRAKQPGAFWLTGSQQFHLMKDVSESLAGRVGVINLLGLSSRELSGQAPNQPEFLPTPKNLAARSATGGPPNLKELYRRIWRGSFPAIALNASMDWEIFYRSYVQTYLQRDVRDLTRVGDEMTFLRFLRAAAARTGQMLNLADLARDADISPNTAKSWLSILQASGMVYLLEPYFNNVTKRIVKSPKLYFIDTGLCAFLTEWSSPETLEAGAMGGAILETWAVIEILKSYLHNGLRAPFYYYRDKDQKEIDLLIVRDGKIYPVEIKKSASPRLSDTKHFSVLEKLKMPIGPGALLCLATKALPLNEKIQAIPVSIL